MKTKIFSGILALLGTCQLFAVRSGDPAVELADVRFLTGSPIRLLETQKKELPACKVVVFLLTRSGNSAGTLLMLDQLAARHLNFARFAAVTPDPRQDAEALLEKVSTKVAFGVDTQRKTTAKYMAGSLLYPMAFVIDNKGMVVWNGEAVDLPEVMEKYRSGKLDPEKEQKISTMLDELQIMMRQNTDRRMRLLANRIFDLDPANAAALRMRLFVLEHTRRIADAWELIEERLKAAPQVERLYHSAWDLISRYPELREKLPQVTSSFRKNITSPEAADAAVITLLTRFEFDAAALASAAEIYRFSAGKNRTDDRSKALHADAGAMLHGKLGKFEKAIELQQESFRIWNAAKEKNAAASAEKMIKYYRKCHKYATKL